MYLVTAEEMQRMDRETIESFGVPGRVLMENAARGATRFLLDRFPDLGRKRVGVMAGRGNNGGDGHVMARYLFQKGIRVAVYLLSEKEKVKGDAAANLELLDKLGVPVVELPTRRLLTRGGPNWPIRICGSTPSWAPASVPRCGAIFARSSTT